MFLPRQPRRSRTPLPAAIALATLVACSGDSGTDPNPTPDTTPASLSVVSGDGQATQAGMALANALVVKVTNAAGDALSGVTIAWTVQAGGGTLASPTTTTGQDGTASNTYTTGGTAGTNTVGATVQGTSIVTAFSATATAPVTDVVPASLAVASGNNQSAAVSTQLANPLVVVVKNAEGQALPSIAVDWAVTSGPGSLGSASTNSNGAGQASNTFTVGASPGSATIEASVQSDPSLKATFTTTATAVVNSSVSVDDNFFDPSSVTVSTGGKVTWTWAGSNQHNITWVSGGFSNASTRGSGTFDVTFATPGTYTYYCSIHGTPTSGMRGTVVVQ
jgi:plastocyanin